MMSDEMTLELLRGIRDEMRSTRIELKAELGELRTEVRSELGDVRSELGELRSEMRSMNHRLTEMDMRHATYVVNHTAATRDLYDLLQNNWRLRDRIERCERDIAELRAQRSVPPSGL
jgi:chromosome segregation ATPase